MELAGMKLLYRVSDMSFMGFAEVIKHLPFIRKVMNRLESWVEQHQPDAVILIDYPGFNLRFARRMKKRNIPVYYYISPQVWAWGKGRLKKMKRLVDKMFVIFPFEKSLYTQHDVPVEFVGHPLVEEIAEVIPRDEFYHHQGFDPDIPTIGLLPGSRHQEIERHFSAMVHAAEIIRSQMDQVQFWVAVAPDLNREDFPGSDEVPALRFVEGQTYEIMQHSDAVMVSSGSATLEIAYFGTPMVILYKMSRLTWWLGNLLVDMPYIGLANIVAEKKIVPELLQDQANPGNIAREILRYFTEPEHANSVRENLADVRSKLGTPGAGKRVAQSIISTIYGDLDTEPVRDE